MDGVFDSQCFNAHQEASGCLLYILLIQLSFVGLLWSVHSKYGLAERAFASSASNFVIHALSLRKATNHSKCKFRCCTRGAASLKDSMRLCPRDPGIAKHQWVSAACKAERLCSSGLTDRGADAGSDRFEWRIVELVCFATSA